MKLKMLIGAFKSKSMVQSCLEASVAFLSPTGNYECVTLEFLYDTQKYL